MISTEKKRQISRLIEEEFDRLELPSEPHSLYEPVSYTLSLSGKRIRPYFTLIGCGLCGGEVEEAIPAAIAIELLHNFTLLHDDIMDSAATRRGEPSVYKKWDASTAILSGDAMYAWAFEQLQYYGKEPHFTKEQYAGILDIFLDSAKTVCEGQAYDLCYGEDAAVSLDDYMKMIKGKTAALISGSFTMGGMVADSQQGCLKRLRAMGTHIGIGFQIQDDLLDVVADPQKFGKKVGGDILEGKKTYLSVLALQKGNREDRQTLTDIFKKDDTNENDIATVMQIYERLQVLDIARQAIREHYDRAVELTALFSESTFKNDLIEFITNLKSREY